MKRQKLLYQDDFWTLEYDIPLRKGENFKYKYFVSVHGQIMDVEWEKGPNRFFSNDYKMHSFNSIEIIKDEWNFRTVKIVFFSSFFTLFSADQNQ